jgi:hypothetical protein
MILVQQSPPRQVIEDDMGPEKIKLASQDVTKSTESIPFVSPTGSFSELVKNGEHSYV